MVKLWREWVMMNRLHCTYTQLRQEPYRELLIFDAFARGEEAAREAERKEATGGR